MTLFHTPRRALKRGGLIAAANWPIILIQASADALVKLVVLVPFVGGVVLVALIVGAAPSALLGLSARDLAATIIALLLARPLALLACAGAMAVAILGGSVFTFLIKGGTVALLVQGERTAAAVEEPPLQAAVVATASVFSIEGFIEASRALFPRFLRLGCALMLVYAASGLVLVVAAFAPAGEEWFARVLLTVLFVVWIAAVNVLYLLTQVVMAAETCGVSAACRRVAGFVRRLPRTVAGVGLVVLALGLLATAASLVATTALGLIGFVPFVGLAVLPLQLVAWLLRGLVLQYISLAAIGAYSALYRGQVRESPERADPVTVRQVGAEVG